MTFVQPVDIAHLLLSLQRHREASEALQTSNTSSSNRKKQNYDTFRALVAHFGHFLHHLLLPFEYLFLFCMNL